MRDLLTELTAALDARRDCVFCSVVDTRGSTPQKAGAAMLVFPDGSQRGTLGGGCVEAEVKQRALDVLGRSGPPEVLTFCLDDNYGWNDGLICGGRMSMLVDPLVKSPSEVQNREFRGPLRPPLPNPTISTSSHLLNRGRASTRPVGSRRAAVLPVAAAISSIREQR